MRSKRSTHTANRRARGSMLVFASVIIALVCVGMLIAASFAGVYFARNHLQATADDIALVGAIKLNDGDRLGQMNNLVIRSRHMVFANRQDLTKIQGDPNSAPELVKLSQQVLDESQQQAFALESERSALIAIATTDATNAMQQRFNQIKGQYHLVLPWLQLDSPTFAAKFGYPTQLDTNVAELTGIDELAQTDRTNGLLTPGLKTSLYKSIKDARLPGADANIPFRLSPLPAPVDKDIAQSRLLPTQSITDTPNFFQPCATHVDMSLHLSTGIGGHADSTLKVGASAVATGGGLMP